MIGFLLNSGKIAIEAQCAECYRIQAFLAISELWKWGGQIEKVSAGKRIAGRASARDRRTGCRRGHASGLQSAANRACSLELGRVLCRRQCWLRAGAHQ